VSIEGVYGVFESCESVIMVCEYNGSVVNVYGINKKRVSVVMERRGRN
jgi:hypothetical protein